MQPSKLNSPQMGAVLLVIIGGLDWLLVGLFNLNLVTAIFGPSFFSRVVFVLVGLSALYLLSFGSKLGRVR